MAMWILNPMSKARATSCLLVGFISTAPRQELHKCAFLTALEIVAWDSLRVSQYLRKIFYLLCLSWQIFQSAPTEEVPFWADVVLGFRKMTKNELKKFPQHVCGQAFTTLKCEGPTYLPWLEKRLVEVALRFLCLSEL